MGTIKSSKAIGQIARAYGVHPITIHKWKKDFMEKRTDIFGQKITIHEYENRIRGNPVDRLCCNSLSDSKMG